MQQQPAILEISKRSSEDLPDVCYRFKIKQPQGMKERLEQPLEAYRNFYEATLRKKSIDTFTKTICCKVKKANKNPSKPEVSFEAFKPPGRGLYRAFFPRSEGDIKELREVLHKLEVPLLISTDSPDIPWELFFDEEEFWGLKYNIGRRLEARGVPSSVPRTERTWRCLIIADPNADEPDWALEDALPEVSELKKRLESWGVNCDDFLHGEDATYDNLVTLLTEHSYDFIHYAGHVVKTGSGGHAFRLNGGELFTVKDIKDFVQGSPFAFLNGCNSGVAIEGLTDAFLEAGAQLVIGSFFDVPDTGARVFAEKFYDTILNGRKTVGEARRLAREHVKGEPEYAASWACFVMYGDPCLQIEEKEDALGKLLSIVELGRKDFEVSSLRVFEQACEYGRSMGGISTAHLFTAMLGGEDGHLRNRLEAQKVPHESLSDAFQKIFNEIDEDTLANSGPAQMRLSKNVEEILRIAKEKAQSEDGRKITELDLVEGFVQRKGGSVAQILHKSGVDIDALSPQSQSVEQDSSGQLTELDVAEGKQRRDPAHSEPGLVLPRRPGNPDKDTWEILKQAEDLARQSGNAGLSTMHLFMGMLQNRTGPAANAFRKMGLDPEEFLRPLKEGLKEAQIRLFMSMLQSQTSPLMNVFKKMGLDPMPILEALREELKESQVQTAEGDDVTYSPNVGHILTLAQATASVNHHDEVTEDDLLTAFVEHGGGGTGRWLEKNGVVLKALISDIFQTDSLLNLSCFDESGQSIVENALDCARKKGHETLGRRHLLYALLIEENGIFPGLLEKQQQDAEHLADLLYGSDLIMRAVGLPSDCLEATVKVVATDLTRILCIAEAKALNTQPGQIGEVHLLRAALSVGCGSAGDFLIQHGVRWQRLERDLDSALS